MRNRVRGLLSPKGEFYGAVFFLVVVPLVPLVIEYVAKGAVQSETIFLTSALFTVSQAFTVRKFSVMLIGFVVVALLLACYGSVLGGAEGEHPVALPSAVTGELQPTATVDAGVRFTNAMYYVCFAVITFFAYIQIAFRRRSHLLEGEAFFEFDGY